MVALGGGACHGRLGRCSRVMKIACLASAVGVQPFVAVPHDGHGADRVESNVGVIAVEQADQPALKYGRATGSIGDDVEYDLRRPGAGSCESVVVGEGEDQSRAFR